LLSALITARDADDVLSEAELISLAFLLLLAGHETSANLLCNAVLALIEHPDQLALLQAKPELLPDAVEEFLRYDGVINLASPWIASVDVQLGDVRIATGETVYISLISANRDERKFPNPDVLDITRQAGGHLGLGHGIHYCVGAPLARLETEIALAHLLETFATISAAGPSQRGLNNMMNGLTTLPVRVTRA
jgi:cytochrome P450